MFLLKFDLVYVSQLWEIYIFRLKHIVVGKHVCRSMFLSWYIHLSI